MATSANTAKKGLAPEIRRLKTKYPEMSQGAIARRLGCSTGNVSTVLKTFLSDHTPEQLQDFQANKAEVYDALQIRLLGSLTREKIEKMPGLAAITGAAILQDKSQVLRGQATGINVIALLDVAEAIKARQSNPPAIRTVSASTIDAK